VLQDALACSLEMAGAKGGRGTLGIINFFFPACLPFQCWSLEVFIGGKTKSFSPFQELERVVHFIIRDVSKQNYSSL